MRLGTLVLERSSLPAHHYAGHRGRWDYPAALCFLGQIPSRLHRRHVRRVATLVAADSSQFGHSIGEAEPRQIRPLMPCRSADSQCS